MPAPSLRVLVCGCGAVTERFYAQALHALEAEGLIRIAGLVDASDRRLAHVGADFPTARQYRDLDRGLADVGAELVIVATPHQFHKDHTIASLLAGSHVLCEKPLALSSSDCDEMIAAAERVGRLLGAGHFRRFFPSVQAIRSAIEAQVMGRPVSFAAFEGEIYRWPVTWSGSYARGANARGVFADIGPHALDLLSWWLGELRMVSYADDAVDGIEVNCCVDLETVDGVRGTLRMSRDTVLPNRHILTFERGWLAYKCDVPDEFEWGWSGAPHRARAALGEPAPTSPMWGSRFSAVPAHPGSAFLLQLRNVVAAIRGTEPLLVSARDARDGIALIERCYAEKSPWNAPWLGDDEQRAAHRRSRSSA